MINESTLVPAGSVARFTGREGRQFGFVKYLAAEKPDVAKALSTPVESLEVNQSLLADWEPVMITVRGEITPGAVSQLSTLLNDNVAGGANWIGVRIDSVGGDLDACITLANQLAELDPNAVRTVAYVPVEAKGGAAVIALACDQLVMAPDAVIGIGPNLAEVGRDDNRNLPQQPRRRRGFKPQREAEDPAALKSVGRLRRNQPAQFAGREDRSELVPPRGDDRPQRRTLPVPPPRDGRNPLDGPGRGERVA